MSAAPTEAQDIHWMTLALQLAEQGAYTTTPNPRVGCVFVKDGQAIAQGYHEQAGQAHAEIQAIRQAQAQGISLQGSTAYVTLEPCAHQGRTGPCANALLPLGITRLVVATLDPNPLVAGKGMAIAQAAGIPTAVGVLETQARWLNRGFFSRMERKRPWVRVKIASSADGITALPNGVSQWITSPEARLDGHCLRAQACAVLSGIGTVQADDPLLNVRGLDTPRQPMKVVIDSQLRIAPKARLLETGETLLVHANAHTPLWLSQHPNAKQIHLLSLPTPQSHTPQVDLHRLLSKLAQRGIQELHVEAGFGLNGALIEADLVDEVVQYIAPNFLGAGKGLFQQAEKHQLPTQTAWALASHEAIGPDLKVVWVRKP
jgi:diaminohydroxyphosphoribosylaminopyrimidine deaminase/5-amino-6-(5-phosphoribosylamino)uracil reductase